MIFFLLLLILVVFYFLSKKQRTKNILGNIIKIILSLIVIIASGLVILSLALEYQKYHNIVKILVGIILPLAIFPIWSKKNRKKIIIYYIAYILIAFTSFGINRYFIVKDNDLKINVNVNIDVNEYMPFDKASKIYRLQNDASLKLTSDLPIVDGAAAVFPVYSAFVNAVYPNTVKYGEEPFLYNNTKIGYKKLAQKKTDIFFGAYPSEDQVTYAHMIGTEFEYTEIGKEGFVFFVNKKNPVNSLTEDQIRDIYSGKITNWKDVGGKNEEIKAFQRNQGSGSQSMLIRFMKNTPIMPPPTEQINDFMSGIINQVADYKNYSNSIGFSFRYYLETLIANPNVKMLSINGVEPTPQNISDGTYPIVTSLYAVTYKDHKNENVDKLINWILSDEGQEIVENTGYSRVK